VAVSYTHVANIYERLCKHEEALEMHKKSLNVMLSDFSISRLPPGGDSHPVGIHMNVQDTATTLRSMVASSHMNIGTNLSTMGKHEEALVQHQKALEVLVAVDYEHPGVACYFYNIACTYLAQGKCEEALEMHTKPLEIKTRIYGGDSLEVASCRNSIGNVLGRMGKSEEALVEYQQALEVSLAVGQEHPIVAISFNNIGEVYRMKGDLENALVQHQKALEIRTRVFGSEHPHVAASYSNIGNVYNEIRKQAQGVLRARPVSQGQYERALEYYQKALEIDIIVSGQEHLNVAVSYNNLANIYDAQGKHEKAKQMSTEATRIFTVHWVCVCVCVCVCVSLCVSV
jgi:tetratricopeptide (TPR) repeat protein